MVEELERVKDIQHFPQIFEEMPIGVALIDLNQTFVKANKTLLEWFGYTEEELKTKTVKEITHEEDREMTEAALKRLLDGTDKCCFLEKRYIKGNNEIVWAHVTLTLLSDGDHPCCLNAFVQNITEHKQTEQDKLDNQRLLEQSNEDLRGRLNELAYANEQLEMLTEKALAAARLKSEFVANISHELRTPLCVSIGLTELLLESRLNEEQAQLTENIFTAGKALLNIIDNLLDFAKIEAGKMELKIVEFNLDAELCACIEMLTPSAKMKQLCLSACIDPAIPRLLKGDPKRVRQVILNLLSNAIKFTDNGKVELECRLESQGNNTVSVSFTVEDTGIGLSPSVQKHIFQPFVQANGTTSRKYGGTGLGLTISERFVELMGGRLIVESEEGRGSCFSFTLQFDCL
jgi:PAS domain S-box-containing protein